MIDLKTFTQGGLNYDTELHLLPKTDWIDALNIRIAASDEQQGAAITNMEGNIRIGEYNYHDGENKCIGAFSDELRNVVYAFIANINKYHEIIEINIETGTITPVFKNMVWTGLVDVLQFDPRFKIHSIDIIHRADDEGDLLFWTENKTRPRKINILRAKTFGQPTGYPSPIIYDYTTVIKKPPRPVQMVWADDLDRSVNNVRGKLFQFQTRYVYTDYEKSVWSSWSDYDLPYLPFYPDRDSDPAINNYINLTLTTGDAEVVKIELAVRQNIENVWGKAYLIETFNKEELSIPDNSTYTYKFYNDTSGVLQDDTETGQLFDYVPSLAGTQALANGNTLVYGDITEGISFDDSLEVVMDSYDSELYTLNPGDNILGYKHSSKYKFGLVYFDEYNRTDGVHNKQVASEPNRKFDVDTTQYLSDATGGTDSYNIFLPKINAAIFHQPPVWAKTYKWVRTKCLSVNKYLYYIVIPVATPDTGNIYLWLSNLSDSFSYDGNTALSYDFTPGDRVRFVRRMSKNAGGLPMPGAENLNIDLEISSLIKDPEIGSEDFKGEFLKIRKTTLSSGFLDVPYLVEIYTPSNIVETDFYYEFGKEYKIINPGTPSRYHEGMIQNQTISQPAKFTFMTDGDVHYRRRAYMSSLVYGRDVNDGLVWFIDLPVSDFNYSDKYLSGVNGNGRAYIVDDNAKEQRLPTTIRYGGAYIQDTFINKTNNFQPANIIDTCDRSFGVIKRLVVRDRQLRVFQELKCGWIPVKQQVLQTGNNTSLVSQSDQLLNEIQYYSGEFGIGNAPCSLASKNFVDYFHDTNRGVICRLSLDGLTPISITSNMNRWAITNDTKYKSAYNIPIGQSSFFASDFQGVAQIYGVFDTKNNEYISAYEELAKYDDDGNRTVINEAKTLIWNETGNRFLTPASYHPEWMTTQKNELITFKNGIPYIHNQKQDGGRCRFYDVNYPCSITLVFNDGFTAKKTFMTIEEVGNVVMACPEIETSILNPNYNITPSQSSNLVEADFRWLESHWHAAFLRDENSPGGIINGDTLKGGYIKVRLQKELAQNLISLRSVAVTYIPSQKNSQ